MPGQLDLKSFFVLWSRSNPFGVLRKRITPLTLNHIHIHIQSVLSAAGPKRLSEVSFLLARTSKTTHKGSDPKQRTNLPAGPHIYGPHIYGPHIYSAADPKQRSEVSFLFACTRKTTRKGSDLKQLPAPGPRSAHGCHIDFDRPGRI